MLETIVIFSAGFLSGLVAARFTLALFGDKEFSEIETARKAMRKLLNLDKHD